MLDVHQSHCNLQCRCILGKSAYFKISKLIELVSKQTLKLTHFSLHFSLHLLREILLICLRLKYTN